MSSLKHPRPPAMSNGTGTIGKGGLAAKDRRRQEASIKHGVKTQGMCSGHEACQTGKCGHKRGR